MNWISITKENCNNFAYCISAAQIPLRTIWGPHKHYMNHLTPPSNQAHPRPEASLQWSLPQVQFGSIEKDMQRSHTLNAQHGWESIWNKWNASDCFDGWQWIRVVFLAGIIEKESRFAPSSGLLPSLLCTDNQVQVTLKFQRPRCALDLIGWHQPRKTRP